MIEEVEDLKMKDLEIENQEIVKKDDQKKEKKMIKKETKMVEKDHIRGIKIDPNKDLETDTKNSILDKKIKIEKEIRINRGTEENLNKKMRENIIKIRLKIQKTTKKITHKKGKNTNKLQKWFHNRRLFKNNLL